VQPGKGAPPVFLFTGPEEGEKKDAIAALKSALKKQAGDLEEFTFYAVDTEVSEALLILRNESLFAPARFVLLRSAESIKKKDDIDAIAAWIDEAAPGGNSTLVLESSENGIERRLENKVPKENKRVFWELFENKKEAWIRAFFSREGYRITDEAVESILALVENNTASLAAECSRFFLVYGKDHIITPQDAEALLMHNREESAFTLFDALTRPIPGPERLENALGILQKIRGTKEGAPQAIIPGLVWCFRRIADWRALCADHPSPSPLDCKKAGFGHSAAQRQYRDAARLWSPAQTAACLALLAEADFETHLLPPEAQGIVLETLLYSLTLKKGRPLAQARF
jgi:DNA polymerase-3 subunit delta